MKKIHINKPVVMLLIAVLIVIGSALLLKTAVSFSVSEKHLKKGVAQFFKENFDKAVEFEDIRITIFGNVVVSNLNISTSSDFNDNISLIKSRSTIIKLDILSLLRKRLLVQEIIFDGTEITMAKMYGESYEDLIKTKFLTGKPLHEIRYIDFDDFRLKLNDGRLMYLEGFRETKTAIECRNVQTRIWFSGDTLSYEAGGTLIPDPGQGAGRGSFRFQGKVIFEKLKRAVFSHNTLQVDNFDLSYMNAFLNEHMEKPLVVSGSISTSIEVNTNHDNLSVTGAVNLDDLSLETRNNGTPYNIVSNENIGLDIIADVLDHRRKVVIKKLRLDDDSIELLAVGTYCMNDDENCIDAAFETKKINLSRVSEYVTPWKDVVYEGTADISGRCRYSFNRLKAGNVALNLGLSDFSMTRKTRGTKTRLVDDLDLALKIRDNSLDVRFSALSKAGDIDLRCRSFIHHWSPLTSQSDIDIRSGSLSAEIIGNAAIRGITALMGLAYEDSSRGYEAAFVNQKPAGMLAEGNNINMRLHVGTIKFNGKDGFKNLTMEAGLNDGYLRLQNFSLSGYGGNYSLELTGFFNSESPGITAKGNFRNINMEKLAQDAGCAGVVRGNLAVDMDYQVNGYRISHIIENAKANISISMDSGYLNKCQIQNRIQEFLADKGFGKPSISELTISHAAINLHQQGENYIVDGITVQSDRINLNTYGSYSYTDGLKIPLNASITMEAGEDQALNTINVPGMIRGHLLAPLLQIKSGKEISELTLFNLD